MSDAATGTNALTRFIAGRRTAWFVALLPLLVGGLLIGMLGEAERQPTPVDQLPAGYDSTYAAELLADLTEGEAEVAIVLWTTEEGEFDRAQLGQLREAVQDGPLIVAEDGTAAYTVLPVNADTSDDNRRAVDDVRQQADDMAPDGVEAQVTGPAAIESDFSEVFAGADVRLLIATASIVAVLLIITYRSPVLWLVPLTVVAVADRLAAILATHLLNAVDGVQWDPSVVGILSVLVFGAGTNYALLLISRYRDELKEVESRHTAMARALRRTAESIFFSSSTVVLGTLSLLLSLFPTTRGLGLACAMGVMIAAAFVLVALPAALVIFGRWIFWPKTPRVGDPALVDIKGFWHKVGQQVKARPKTLVVGTVAGIAVLASGMLQMETGLRAADQFLETPRAITAAERLAESFPAGTSDPLEVVTQDDAEQVREIVAGVDGVGSAEVAASRNGTSVVNAVVTVDPSSAEGKQVVRDLRGALEEYDRTYVTGGEAEVIDEADGQQRDRLLIIPVVLLLVLVGLGLLLRSVVAPLILVATVVGTYAAAMGLSWWVFSGIFDFPAIHQNVPLIAFLFLVALGVDYNIFLVTRAREESAVHGTREGMLRALRATGGVITSAGILLGSVFAVLGVLPLVMLAQIGIIIFIGVLLDTLVVRTVLVPSIAVLLGDRFWWPRRPAGDGRGDADGAAGDSTVSTPPPTVQV